MFKNVVLILVLSFFVSGCSSNDTVENFSKEEMNESNSSTLTQNSTNEITIVAFGDSLTQGYGLNRDHAYPAQLQEILNTRNYSLKVSNSGLSGETSTGALERVNWVLQLNPEIVILTTGANDAFRGVDLEITRNNIEEIILTLKENNVTLILGGMEIVENLGQEYVKEFESIYPSLAQKHDIYLIESFLGRVAGNSSLNQEDEIHPTKEGYEIIVKENILPVLERVINNKFSN